MKKRTAPQQLTVAQATSQARRHVDRVMPGAMATVESKFSHDLATDTALVITTVTYPATDHAAPLFEALKTLPGTVEVKGFAARAVITRTR